MYENIARIAERGCLDMLFSSDGTGVPDTWRGSRDAAIEWGINWPLQDLNPIMVAMSRVTRHIGFGLACSSTFMNSYYSLGSPSRTRCSRYRDDAVVFRTSQPPQGV